MACKDHPGKRQATCFPEFLRKDGMLNLIAYLSLTRSRSLGQRGDLGLLNIQNEKEKPDYEEGEFRRVRALYLYMPILPVRPAQSWPSIGGGWVFRSWGEGEWLTSLGRHSYTSSLKWGGRSVWWSPGIYWTTQVTTRPSGQQAQNSISTIGHPFVS